MSQALFVGGTASHVGKSWFTAALCRLLWRRGVKVVPFKAQNMSNNSYPCVEGGEIGRSQAMQAEACGLPAMADMNPVLLKPESERASQVVVRGRVWRSVEAARYYDHSATLMQLAVESFERLSAQFDCVVCEGAGSVAEMNLMERDITNLRFAERVNARALLVADIERGGVFASLVGTLELLPASQRKLVRAFAVNRFRGDPRLFDEGVRFLEDRLGIPCLGVFPFARDIVLDDEDCLSIEDGATSKHSEVAVIRLPRISNFTDFRALGEVAWITKPADRQYRVVFLPGTKNTVEDLLWLRERGLDEWVKRQHAGGALIVGICGGYQMLGQRVEDPEEVESSHGCIDGLCLLPVRTVLQREKVTCVVEARTRGGVAFRAYEIHMGISVAEGEPFAYMTDGRAEGCRMPGAMGTYLHGAFDTAGVVKEMLGLEAVVVDKAAMYDKLADWLVANARKDVLEALVA